MKVFNAKIPIKAWIDGVPDVHCLHVHQSVALLFNEKFT